jgi:hypothetical protein
MLPLNARDPIIPPSLKRPFPNQQVSMVRGAAQGVAAAASMLPWVAPEVLRTPELVTGKVRRRPAAQLITFKAPCFLYLSLGLKAAPPCIFPVFGQTGFGHSWLGSAAADLQRKPPVAACPGCSSACPPPSACVIPPAPRRTFSPLQW